MRMDKENPLSAYEVVNNYTKEQLSNIFYKYGEDKFSNNIAKKIVEYRQNKDIETEIKLPVSLVIRNSTSKKQK